MADTPSVEVQIRARLDQLERDLAQAKAKLNQFNQSVSSGSGAPAAAGFAARWNAATASVVANLNALTNRINQQQTLLGRLGVAGAAAVGATARAAVAPLQLVTSGVAAFSTRVTAAVAGSGLLSRQMAALSGQAQSLAGNLGRAAPFLAGFGPAGLAVAAALGAVAVSAHLALRVADVGGALKDLGEVTGFAVEELQALQQAGARVGLSTAQTQTGLERFTFALNDAREGAGQLYDAVRQVDAGIADELARTSTAAEAWDVLTKAIQAAASAEQRIAIARAAGGRGFSGGVRLAAETAGAGGVQGLVSQLNHLDRITKEQASSWDALGDTIRENMEKARNNVAATFAEPVLELFRQLTEQTLEWSRSLREFEPPQAFQEFMDWLVDPRLITAATGLFEILSRIASLDFSEQAGDLNRMALKGILGAGAAGSPAGLPDSAALAPPDRAGWDEYANSVLGAGDATERFRQSTILAAAASKRTMEALSGTATPAEVLRDKMLQLDAIAAKYPDQAGAVAVAQKRLQAEFANTKVQAGVAALGDAATASERYRAQVSALNEQLRLGLINQQEFNRALANLQASIPLDEMRNNISALGDAATAAERYDLQVAELEQKLRQGTISQDTFNRAVANLEPTTQQLKGVINDLGAALAQAFIQGQDSAEALNNSLKSIAATAASGAIKDFLKGPSHWADAAFEVAVAGTAFLASTILGDNAKQNAERNQKFAEAQSSILQQIQQFNQAAAAAAPRPTTRAEALSSFDAQAAAQRQALIRETSSGLVATATANAAVASLNQKLAAERLQVEREFTERATALVTQSRDALAGEDLTAVQKRLSEITQAAADLTTALTDLGASTGEVADAVAAAADKLRADFTTDLQRRINAATGRTFVNQFLDLFEQVDRARQDAIRLGLGQGLVDRFFGVSAQKIVDDAGLMGGAFNELLLTFPQLTGVVHESSTALAEATERLNNAGRTIVDYVNQLLAGPESTLSPQARFAQAQSTYNAQLLLAQTAGPGQLAAQETITKYAEDFRVAARDFHGSSAAYQTIFSGITSALLALPAVSGTTDPVVLAIRDSITELQSVKTNTGQTKTAVDATTAAADFPGAITNPAGTNAILGAIKVQIDFLSAVNQNTQNIANNTSFVGGAIGGTLIEIDAKLATSNVTLAAIAVSTAAAVGGAAGGWVTGGVAGKDSVPMTLMPGEFIVSAQATRAIAATYGRSVFDSFINRGRLPVAPLARVSVVGAANDNGSMIAAALYRIEARIVDALERGMKVSAVSAEMMSEGLQRVSEKIDEDSRERKLRVANG